MKKLAVLEQELAAAYGPFVLYAILKREEAPDKWDLVVAASWLPRWADERTQQLYRRVSQSLSPAELVQLSRVVVLKPDEPFVGEIGRLLEEEAWLSPPGRLPMDGARRMEGRSFEFRDRVVGEMEFDRGIVVTYNPEAAAAAPTATS